jgi:hypothetical protein
LFSSLELRQMPGQWSELTFTTHLAVRPEQECQIQNSTGNLYLLVAFHFNIRKKAR